MVNAARILIVEDHSLLRNAIAKYLMQQEGIGIVIEASNGAEALKCISETTFDLVVTDIVMPVMDGYMLMEAINKLDLKVPPKVIVMSSLGRDDFVAKAIGLGAEFYMIKPFESEYLYAHIKGICLTPPKRDREQPQQVAQADEPTLDEQLKNIFLTIGIPAHIKGFQYLRVGVSMVIGNPDMINRITKELYPSIATSFNASTSNVERGIRHAIEIAWTRGRVDLLNNILGCKVCSPQYKPTNGEFIALIASKLRVKYDSSHVC